MRNQQLFFRELASQSTRWENLLRLPGVARAFGEHAVTDMSISQILDVGQSLKGISEDGMYTTTLPGEWRSPYVIADEMEKERLVEAFRTGEPFEPVVEEEDLLPQDISVAVRNGGGLDSAATQGADALEAEGFDIAEISNANQFVYEETLVVYADEASEPMAALVLERLGIGELVPSRGMYAFSTDVLVVIGKDWATRQTQAGAPAGQ
jgi:hypothetical protein